MSHAHEAVVRIYESELAVLVDETARHPSIETGGALFGLWSHNGSPTVFLASRPGPDSVHHPTSFQVGPDTHHLLETLLWRDAGVQHIGLWHSHHTIGLHELSRGDIVRASNLARKNHRPKFTDVLCYIEDARTPGDRLVPTVHLKPHVYSDAVAGVLQPTIIETLPGESPVRARLREIRDMPDSLVPSLQGPPLADAHLVIVNPRGPAHVTQVPGAVAPLDATAGRKRQKRKWNFSKERSDSASEPELPAHQEAADAPLPSPLEAIVSEDAVPDAEALPTARINAHPEPGLLPIDDPQQFLNVAVGRRFAPLASEGVTMHLLEAQDARVVQCMLSARDDSTHVLLVLGRTARGPIVREGAWFGQGGNNSSMYIANDEQRFDIERALRWAWGLFTTPRAHR